MVLVVVPVSHIIVSVDPLVLAIPLSFVIAVLTSIDAPDIHIETLLLLVLPEKPLEAEFCGDEDPQSFFGCSFDLSEVELGLRVADLEVG